MQSASNLQTVSNVKLLIFYTIPSTYPRLRRKSLSLGHISQRFSWESCEILNYAWKVETDSRFTRCFCLNCCFGLWQQWTGHICYLLLFPDYSTFLVGLCYISYSWYQISSSKWLPQHCHSTIVFNYLGEPHKTFPSRSCECCTWTDRVAPGDFLAPLFSSTDRSGLFVIRYSFLSVFFCCFHSQTGADHHTLHWLPWTHILQVQNNSTKCFYFIL